MIRLLFDTTIAGLRVGKGSILDLDDAEEAILIAEGDATRAIDFASTGLLSELVSQSFQPVIRTANGSDDTTLKTIAQVLVRGGRMLPNSELIIDSDWDVATTGGTKSLWIDIGGINVFGPTLSGGNTGLKAMIQFQNTNSLVSQTTLNGSTYQVVSTAPARTVTSIDTQADFLIEFKCKWSGLLAGPTIALTGHSIWHRPAP